jgi:hypothetical protein
LKEKNISNFPLDIPIYFIRKGEFWFDIFISQRVIQIHILYAHSLP